MTDTLNNLLSKAIESETHHYETKCNFITMKPQLGIINQSKNTKHPCIICIIQIQYIS